MHASASGEGTSVASAPAPLTIAVTATPEAAVPGGTVLYKIELTNTSPNAPTGAFTVQSDIPRGVTVNRPQGGKCAPIRCDGSNIARYGSNVNWNLKSLAPGATASVQFTAVVEKPANAAPAPNGSVLATRITVPLHGTGRSGLTVVVGTASNLGSGAPLVAYEESKPDPKPAKTPEKPNADQDKPKPEKKPDPKPPAPEPQKASPSNPAPAPDAAAKPTAQNEPKQESKGSGVTLKLNGSIDLKAK